MARLLFFLPAVIFTLAAFAQNAQSAGNDVVRSVITDKSGITIETRIVLEKAGEQAKITFLQETENGFIFKNVNWTGSVLLYLENGATIHLEDSNMKRQAVQLGGYIGGYYVPNRYERYASYILSTEECALLRQSSIKRVEYYLDDNYNKHAHSLELQDQNQFLKAQLTAIGM
ncbi:MAG: hypothetical protein SH857_06555 [Chitinophagales bacterium]|nr:hypothetical protein [Chitinophagales bacterium]